MSQRLVAVKECPPKWRLLQEVVAEITDCIKTQRSAQRTATRRFDHNHNCIVVFVRDARTTAQVRDILIDGDACVLDQRHRWLVSQLAADVRSKGNMSSSLIRPSSNDQSIYNRGGSSIAQSSGNASAAASLVRDSCSENQDGCSTSDIRSSSSSSSSSSSRSGSSASSGHAESSDYGGLNLSKKQFDYCSLDGKMLLIHVSSIVSSLFR